MRFLLALPLMGLPVFAGCASSSSSGGSSSCSTNASLAGASYDVTKSRFAFGSTPTRVDAGGGLVRWTGSHGVVAIFPDGSEMAELNANAPESSLAGWGSSSSDLTTHVVQYWSAMGVVGCQITNTSANASVGGSSSGGSSTTTIGQTFVSLARGIDGVPVSESLAVAQFDVDDQTTYESFYWPEIPAAVVSGAVAFQNQLADPHALAAYKAKLPSDAQGMGRVNIHHTHAGGMPPLQSGFSYDVVQSTPEGDGAELSFDPSGSPITTTW
jgi:hypothetical protein